MRKINNSKICPILGAKIMSQSNEKLPVIVQLKKDDNRLEDGIMSVSTNVKKRLPLINGIACDLDTETIYKLASNPNIEYISFDSEVYTLLDISVPTMEAQFPYAQGYKGKGITVGVIDTGVAPHQDLTKPVNRIIDFKDFVNNETSAYDDNGHGTHVAGIIAGNGYSSRGLYSGIAPESNILAIKALNDNGSGNTSDIIDAIAYAIETKDEFNTKILNLSFGSPANSNCNKDPLCNAVKKATKVGLIVVTAAGNSGPNEKTIVSPGISPDVITVGAVDHRRTIDTSDDVVASFSSRGPTNEGLSKPDIVAPGVGINSLSNTKPDGYKSLSGTSMATPLISGSVALLLNKYNSLSHNEVKKKLMDSCIDLDDEIDNQGSGLINLQKLFNGDSKNDENLKRNSGLEPFNSTDNIIENFLVLLLVLYLLDKNI
ncbi:S8 family peptidase [Schnuerera sp. xch1]|uniref:S8 family peptidase n=1 Tax=Schnuerera sp. xch1 TaxID=2874283 RepID=UPI001CBC0A92|nr:S8 family peptidase [Schnuerera sp. xch1]MBZ2175679.1 S8 family peptidase [Schnuerera sp. xch1]